MDSSVVNKDIKKAIWPQLRDVGFSQFTARTAWRYGSGKIDVVNFQSFNSYLASGIGCTTYSFAVNLGCSFDAIPRLKTVELKNGCFRPKEWECHFRVHLLKTISQPALERANIWYVDPSGQNLTSVTEDASNAIQKTGLPWFDRFRDAKEVLRTLLEDSESADRAWGFGNEPSPERHLQTGFVASSLGEYQLALEHIQSALLSGCFKDLEPQLFEVLEATKRRLVE